MSVEAQLEAALGHRPIVARSLAGDQQEPTGEVAGLEQPVDARLPGGQRYDVGAEVDDPPALAV